MEKWKELATVAQAVAGGARVEDLDADLVAQTALHGLLERREQTKACPTCGTPKFDFSFWCITPAGRLLIAALAADAAISPETER